jgi:NodT family efflux transporter outer membrane factor (OMF) lipoprotein
MRKFSLPLLCILFVLTAGCAVGPNFTQPENGLGNVRIEPEGNAELPSPVAMERMPNAWWSLFGDPMLDSLQTRAHEANLDLQSAYTRIDQSRATLGIVTAGLLPVIGADASYSRQALSEKGPMAALGAPTDAHNFWQTGLTALWELDLWGRNRRLRERGMALTLAKTYEKELVHVAMSAEVANTYILLRGAQSRFALARRNEQIARDCLNLVQTRLSNGIATNYEVASAKSELAQTSALAIESAHQCEVLMNGLAMLLALPPGSLEAELGSPKDIPALPDRVPLGLPSELAGRRPDILQAEANLHAATAAIGVTEANFYPSITLTGTLGLQAFEWKDLGFWDARWFAAGPSIYLPLFQGGRMLKELELRKAEHVQAALEYRKTVLTAWHEIDNALRFFAAEQKQQEELHQAYDESERAFNKVRRSYQEGEASYLEMLIAQRNVLARKTAWRKALTQSACALVALYKAVGGGWDDEQLIHNND